MVAGRLTASEAAIKDLRSLTACGMPTPNTWSSVANFARARVRPRSERSWGAETPTTRLLERGTDRGTIWTVVC